MNLEIRNKLQGIFITKQWVQMFNTNLKMSFSNTDICTDHADVADHHCFRNKNPGTIVSHNCTENPLPYNKVIGVAFSLIVIMLQAKFLFVRVHSLVVSNILPRENLKGEHIN